MNGRLTKPQTPLNVLHEACRREKLQQRIVAAEQRARDELAAEQPQHVAVTGVARRYPYAVVLGHRPDQRQEVLRQTKDSGPSVRDLRQLAEQFDQERVERL